MLLRPLISDPGRRGPAPGARPVRRALRAGGRAAGPDAFARARDRRAGRAAPRVEPRRSPRRRSAPCRPSPTSSRSASATAARSPRRGNVPAPDKLSRREREVLALLALGHTNREIAERVHLSIRTVEWHRARIQAKLRVTGRAALAQVARAHGLLSGTDARTELRWRTSRRSVEIGTHLQRMSRYCALIAAPARARRRADPDREPPARRRHGRGQQRHPRPSRAR